MRQLWRMGGYNGCGCNLSYATDTSASAATFHTQTENWTEITNDSYDSGGNAYYAYYYGCNYAVNSYSFNN